MENHQKKVRSLMDSQLFRDSVGNRTLEVTDEIANAAASFFKSVETIEEKAKDLNKDRNFLHTSADEYFTSGRNGVLALIKNNQLERKDGNKIYNVLNQHEVDLLSGNYSSNIQKLTDYFLVSLKSTLTEVLPSKGTDIEKAIKDFEDAYNSYNTVKRIKTLQERVRELHVNVEAYLSGLPLEHNHAYFSGKFSGQEKMDSLIKYLNDADNYTFNLSSVKFKKAADFKPTSLHESFAEVLGAAKKVEIDFNDENLNELHTAYNQVAATFQILTSTVN